jgi:hypothetical protein
MVDEDLPSTSGSSYSRETPAVSRLGSSKTCPMIPPIRQGVKALPIVTWAVSHYQQRAYVEPEARLLDRLSPERAKKDDQIGRSTWVAWNAWRPRFFESGSRSIPKRTTIHMILSFIRGILDYGVTRVAFFESGAFVRQREAYNAEDGLSTRD